MIIQIFKEGEQNNELVSNNSGNNSSEIQRIRSLLDTTYVKYISDNIQKLLNIKIDNDISCFEINNRIRIIQDNYRVILYIRLSEEDEDIIDGDVSKSIRNQLLMLLDECEKRGWRVVRYIL